MIHTPPPITILCLLNQAGHVVKVSSHPVEMCSPPPTLLLHCKTAEI